MTISGPRIRARPRLVRTACPWGLAVGARRRPLSEFAGAV